MDRGGLLEWQRGIHENERGEWHVLSAGECTMVASPDVQGKLMGIGEEQMDPG